MSLLSDKKCIDLYALLGFSHNVLPICDVGCPAYERVGAVVAEGKHRDKKPCAR